MTSMVIAAALAATLVPAARPQAVPPPKLDWQRDFKAAQGLAAAEGKLLLVCVMKDSEPACVEMMEKVYADATVAKKLAGFVLVPCSITTHDLIQLDVGGQKTPSCPRFQGILCSEHQALEKELRDRFLDPVSKDVLVPLHAVLAPDGKPVIQRPYLMKRDGFLEFLSTAIALGKDPATPAAPRSPPIQKLVDAILKAKGDDDRETAAKELTSDCSPEREDAFFEVMGRLKREEDLGQVIRTAGRPERKAWAPILVTQLESKHAWVRDCTVVSLEEEKNPAVLDSLLALWEREKDPETKKDLLRALGPCGNRQKKPRDLLLSELGSTKDGHRVACSLSLGQYLTNDAEVAAALEARWQKERDEKVKLAILWGISGSNDAAQVELVERLIKDERNATLREVADSVKQRLKDGGAPGGGGWRVLRLLAPIYADDKVVRNVVKDFGRGGPGGK
jgi:hypothetical protein